jgi:hypothetical protein
MPRGQKDKLYRTFNKGLVTEAGFLTYPEDASIDELNTVLYRKGNRSRRLGIDFEEGSTGFTVSGLSESSVTTEYLWKAPSNNAKLNMLVMQVGRYLLFFDLSVTPLSEGIKDFVVDLADFKSPTATLQDI